MTPQERQELGLPPKPPALDWAIVVLLIAAIGVAMAVSCQARELRDNCVGCCP